MAEQNKALCILVNEAIKDENQAPVDYNKLLDKLEDTGNLNMRRERMVNDIISQENSHERYFERLAIELGCPVSQKKNITRML